MKETVKLINVGGSIGFTIPPIIIKDLGSLDIGDSIQLEITQIFRKTGESQSISAPMRRKVIKVGGGSKGATVKRNVVNRFKLIEGLDIVVDFKI